MKNKILFLLLISLVSCNLYSSEKIINSFLLNYFEDNSFFYEKKIIDKKELYFAYRIIDNNHSIFNKSIIFIQTEAENISPILYITSNVITDKDGINIFEGISNTQIFFGWKINIVERNNSFSLDFYTNDGVNVTEGPILIWNSSKNTFQLYVIDKSQW